MLRKKHRVPLHGKPNGYVEIESGATEGAVVGVNVWNQDGTLFVPAAGSSTDAGGTHTYWRLILEIPPNVVALAGTTTTGLYVITGGGASATRAIQPVAGETTVSNGNGVAGNPVVGLADVTPTAGGTLQKYGFDAKGRRVEEEAADTDDLAEGSSNLYFTNARADARITAQKGQPNGLATLDADAKLEANQLPALAITDTFNYISAGGEPYATEDGDLYIGV